MFKKIIFSFIVLSFSTSQNVQLNELVSLNTEIIGIYKSVNVIEFKFYFENEKSIKIAKGKIQIGIIQ